MKHLFTIAVFLLTLLPLQAEIAITAIVDCVCQGNPQQAFSVIAEGSAGPFLFKWSGPGGYTSTAMAPTNIETGGAYTLMVTNAFECTFQYDITIPACPGPTFHFETTPAASCNLNGGAINLTTTGGSGPFQYAWYYEGEGAGLPSQPQAGMVQAGAWRVEITDAQGCTFTSPEVVVEQLEAISISGERTETCPEQATGSIGLTTMGGAAPYTYTWSNGANTPNLSGLATGVYTVTVEDSRGCTETGTFKILSSSLGIFVNATTTPPTCPSSADGAIQLAIQPAGAYTVAWSNGMAGASISGLAAGSYAATITDANGCSAEKTVTLPALPSMEIYLVAVTPTTCPEAADGGAILSADGGTPPYSFNWGTGNTGGDIDGLAAGAYSATATDANGCTVSTIVNIPAGPGISVQAATAPMACAAGPDGAVSLSVSGASGELSYSWSGPEGPINENSAQLTCLPAGQYCATVTDGVGCSGSGCWVMEAPEEEWPYLEEVTIRASNSSSNTGSIIYSGRWVETVSGCLFFQGGNTPNFTYQVLQEMGQGLVELEVLARSNRELSSFSLSVAGNDFFPSPPANVDATFTIDALSIQAMIVNNTIDQALSFQGTDMDGRPLLDLFSNNPSLANCVYPPRLQPDCSWSPAPAITYALNGTDGVDRVHLLKKECISFEYSLDPELGSIKITEISGGTGPFTLHWENLNPEATIINNGWLVVNLESGGEYCLRILDVGTECTVSGLRTRQ